MLKKTLKIILSFLVIFCTLTVVSIKADATDKEYEIYPKPHSITYQDGDYVMRGKVNVVYDETIDTVTKNRLKEILKSKNKEITVSDAKDESKTNIFVGTYNSEGKAYEYAKANYSLDEDVFNKISGQEVISNNGEIVIIGKDTDAAFYGITSLKHIFNQIDGSTLRNFTIKDYADTKIRGFIEGYYGIPWTNEDRMSLMKFGGDFKMTAYVFAPKDDPYHAEKWRDLYPEAELNAVKEMVQVGIDTKCNFVWTAHPFKGGFDGNKKDEEIASLLSKFDQLYSAGVRQFGVLGDDVGALDRSVVIEIMQAVSDWGKAKGDVFDPVFCPAGYNDSWQTSFSNYEELNDYDKGFPKDVQIFWTGEAVCQPVEQKTLTKFKTKNLAAGQPARRNPLFWLNWPVNDINGSRLMMGKGSLLQTDININDISGVVTNPMQEAEASKVALFAVADYSWNVKEFDDDKSWADSFKYIDGDASDDLHTLAKHMSNPEPNGHGLVLAESEELKPLINQFKTKLSAGESIIETGNQLIKEMDIIIKACDGFNATTKNQNLKKELKPFTGSLKDLTKAIKNYIAAAIALENNEKNTAFNAYTEATADFNSSKNHERKTLDGSTKVSPGSTHLIPLANAIQKAISSDISGIVGGESKLKLTATSSFTSFYSGKNEDIIDGSLLTSAWYGGYEAAGQYYQVNLSQPTTIYGVNITNGTTAKPTDTFGYAKVKYSTDNGKTWKDMSSTEYGEYQAEVNIQGISLDKVTNVRYECTRTGTGNKWPAMREFEVLTNPVQESKFTLEVMDSPVGWDNPAKRNNMIDGDDATSVHFNVRQNGSPSNTTIPGDYVGIKLSQPIMLGKVHIVQARDDSDGDYFKNVDLEYSIDGITWTKIATYNNQRNIDIDLSDQDITAQYLRLKNNVEQGTWIGMREFQVKEKVFFNSTAYTNVDAYKSIKAKCLDDSGTLAPTNGITLANNDYIGLKLGRIHQLKTITTDLTNGTLTLQVSNNGIEWKNVTAGQMKDTTGRYARLINLTGASVTLDIREFTILTDEIQPKTVSKTSGFSVGTDRLNVFDGDRTSQTIYNGSQIAGRYFTYDLGQTIDLKTFKAVCRDSEGDFPRHGKFSASEDGTNWTEIMTIGNQTGDNPGEAENTDNITDVLPLHEISYNAKESVGLNLKARYIKFEITRTKTGADKWVRFQEFEINGGEYIPTENNPTFESTSKETAKGLLSYMTDGDLSTMFIPADKNGSLTYKVSEKNDSINAVKIIQNSNAISNAVVKARIMRNTTRSTDEWVNLGTLSQTINEFNIPANATLLDVKVEWNNTDLNITEFMLFNSTTTAVDKSLLQDKVDHQEDISTWTTGTAKAYQDAIELAKKVLANENVAQSSIDNVVEVINKTVSDKKEKGDMTALQEAIDNAHTDSNKYTVSTWKAYTQALDTAKALIAQKDNYSQDEIDTCLTNLQTAQTNLVYNPTNRELAIIENNDAQSFIDAIENPNDLYTVNSFEALKSAQAQLNQLIEEDKTTPQDPDKFSEAVTALEEAKTKLVNVKTLPSLIKEFDAFNKDIYTAYSYKAYQDAIDIAKELVINGTEAAIDENIQNILKSKVNLVLIEDKDSLAAYIKDLGKLSESDYTYQSYGLLKTLLSDDDKIDLDTATKDEMRDYYQKLKSANDNLVSIVSLKSVINSAKKVNKDMYTISSYNTLLIAINSGEKLYIDGTNEQISQASVQVDKAMRSLKLRVNENQAKSFIESLKKADSRLYTKDSYSQYEKAYNRLTAMLKNLSDISADEYLQAINDYNKAYYELKSIDSKDDVQTSDNTLFMGFVAMGLIALTTFVVLKRKKEID